MVNKHIKIHSTSLVIKEMLIKITTFYSHLNGYQQKDKYGCTGYEETGSPIICLWNVKCTTLEKSGSSLIIRIALVPPIRQ